MTQRLLVILFFFSTLIASLTAQLTPQEAIVGMGRGINLGNTLEPPSEGFWNNGPAEEKYFDAYVEAGFRNVRIPVSWYGHTQEEVPYAVDAEWMDRVEEVVDWGLDRGLYVTLNGHHEDWLKTDYGNPANRARYDSIWVQIIERFGDKSERLLFEIINEPNGMTVAEVDDLNARILGLIRADNPTRLVVFGGNVYANSAELLAAKVPEDDYVIGYFHSYDPFQFGLEGQGTWGTTEDYQQLDRKFKSVDDWSTANGVPVYLSEFGTVLSADYNSRMRFYAAFTEAALRYEFAFSAWDDGGMFRILNREENTWPEVKDILINTYETSPTDVVATASDPADTLIKNVLVTWRTRSEVAPIMVQRRTGEDAFVTVATVDADATNYTDSNVETGNFYTYRLATTDSEGNEVQSYPARVLLAGEQLPFGDLPFSLVDTLQVENFDRGGEGVAYHDTESENIPGVYRPDEGVDIDSTGAGGIAVGYIARNEWLEYTVTVPQAGTYSLSASIATAQGGGSMQLSSDPGGVLTTLSVPSEGTGDYDAFETFSGNGVVLLDSGLQVLRIDFIGNQPFNLDYLVFTPAVADTSAIVNYNDQLDTATTAFSGEPGGITYTLADGVLTVVGDGTSPQYQTFRYALPDTLLADAVRSQNKLYVRARTTSGNPVNLRVDLIDENEFATTLAGKTRAITGPDYADYLYDFAGSYQDGGYGGTACPGPAGTACNVDGSRIKYIAFYPEPVNGMFDDTLQIDYLSFGLALDTTTTDTTDTSPVGVLNYQDNFDGDASAFSNTPAGITYGVADGLFTLRGDGTSQQYQTVYYGIQGEDAGAGLANVAGSNDLLFVRARTLGSDSVNLRIDLADRLNRQTTNAGRTLRIGGPDFATYSINYAGGYEDGGYGGTGCEQANAPCAVDAERIVGLIFYPEPINAMFNDTLEIDWISFGEAITVGVRDFAELERFSVFPNPASEVLNVRVDLNVAADVAAELYDATGRRVATRGYGDQAAGTLQVRLPLNDLPEGAYFLRLRVNDRFTRAVTVSVR